MKTENLYKGDEKGYSIPHDPEIFIVLKQIKNPVAMYARNNVDLWIPESAKSIGFDLFLNDWVAPYGNGKEPDLVFNWSGLVSRQLTDAQVEITVGEGGGICKFEIEDDGSLLKSEYQAPEFSEYESRVVHSKYRKIVDSEAKVENTYEEGIGYYLLLRPKFDASGDLIEARYGKIYGDFDFVPKLEANCLIRIRSIYVNPAKNDRTVEFDLGRNLLHLPRGERVTVP